MTDRHSSSGTKGNDHRLSNGDGNCRLLPRLLARSAVGCAVALSVLIRITCRGILSMPLMAAFESMAQHKWRAVYSHRLSDFSLVPRPTNIAFHLWFSAIALNSCQLSGR